MGGVADNGRRDEESEAPDRTYCQRRLGASSAGVKDGSGGSAGLGDLLVYLRLVEFPLAGATVRVRSFSPPLGSNLTDPDNRFTCAMEPGAPRR